MAESPRTPRRHRVPGRTIGTGVQRRPLGHRVPALADALEMCVSSRYRPLGPGPFHRHRRAIWSVIREHRVSADDNSDDNPDDSYTPNNGNGCPKRFLPCLVMHSVWSWQCGVIASSPVSSTIHCTWEDLVVSCRGDTVRPIVG